jgi:hypothetical protein
MVYLSPKVNAVLLPKGYISLRSARAAKFTSKCPAKANLPALSKFHHNGVFKRHISVRTLNYVPLLHPQHTSHYLNIFTYQYTTLHKA